MMVRNRTSFIRILLLIVTLMIIEAVILVAWLTQRPSPPSKAPIPTGMSGQLIRVTKIVVAFQPIERGRQISTGTVGLFDWPTTQVPPNTLTDPSKAIGKYATMDIPQGTPIVVSMLALSSFDAWKLIPMDAILVATQPITHGERVVESSIVPQCWPKDQIPNGAISVIGMGGTKWQDILGRIARVDIQQGMPILESMLIRQQ